MNLDNIQQRGNGFIQTMGVVKYDFFTMKRVEIIPEKELRLTWTLSGLCVCVCVSTMQLCTFDYELKWTKSVSRLFFGYSSKLSIIWYTCLWHYVFKVHNGKTVYAVILYKKDFYFSWVRWLSCLSITLFLSPSLCVCIYVCALYNLREIV